MSVAAIAALIGNRRAAAAVKDAKRRFRVLPMVGMGVADLSEDQVAEERKEMGRAKRSPDIFPAARLEYRTRPGAFGECDGFVSHSWRDPPDEKLVKLAAWGASVGPTATIWLDKACIDRSDVDASLMCLPYFVCACNALVVLAGPTLSSRLWCAMEAFIFVSMNRYPERVHVLPFGIDEPDDGDDAARWLFLDFSASKAKCTFDRDRQLMLAAIESAFGSLTTFDDHIHTCLHNRRKAKRVDAIEGSRSRTSVKIAPATSPGDFSV